MVSAKGRVIISSIKPLFKPILQHHNKITNIFYQHIKPFEHILFSYKYYKKSFL